MTPKTVMIFGYGVLGGRVLDEVVRRHPEIHVFVAGRNSGPLDLRVNLARYAAVNYGCSPRITPLDLDLLEVGRVAAAVRDVEPDVIFNATSMLPWWVLDQLPADLSRQIKSAGSGIWAATDLLLPLRLSQALKTAGYTGTFINGSFPDLVNPMIYDVEIGPVCGIGNVANAVPGVVLAAHEMLGRPRGNVRVRFVAHHFTSYNMPVSGTASGAPFELQVLLDEEDVSDRLSTESIFAAVAGKFRRVKGLAGQAVTVSSAMRVLDPILDGSERYAHTPGYRGLPGGYPVRIRNGDVELDLPSSLTPDDASSINAEAGRWDGIRSVSAADGVYVTDEAYATARDLLGYDANGITAENCETKAFELVEKFSRLGAAGSVQ